MRNTFFILCLFLLPFSLMSQRVVSNSGEVTFLSEAPLEKIMASSTELKGVHDLEAKTFAYSVPIRSFDGFNSKLQKEHFNTRYLHSDNNPNATFTGKIIEDVDWTKSGNQTVRTKGNFTVNGVSHSRIILVNIEISDNKIKVSSNFQVHLSDHDIKIPVIVESNISKIIKVSMQAEFDRE